MAIPSITPLEFSGINFDYIVIGGGTAGLAVAARLSEVPHLKVGVIEAGPAAFDEPLINIPGKFGQTIGTRYDWQFETTVQPGLDGRKVPWPRGKVLGGTSALNFMAWTRGNREDYDAWEELGNPGWGWESLLPYFKKSESFSEPSCSHQEQYNSFFDPRFHGDSGPVQTVHSLEYWPSGSYFQQAINSLGVKMGHDSLAGSNVGWWNMLGSVDHLNRTRSYSATAYYRQNSARPNLFLLTNALTTEILIEEENGGWLAKGVRFSYDDEDYIANASREVILSAGSVQSPQLLELSGIGSPSVLKDAGIPVKVSNQNVGENLQEHMMTMAVYEVVPSVESLDDLKFNRTLAEAAEKEYANFKTGPLANLAASVAYISLHHFLSAEQLAELSSKADRAGDPSPRQSILARRFHPAQRLGQVEYIFDTGNWSPFFQSDPSKKYATLLQILQYPFSKGSIHIAPMKDAKPASIHEPPVINPNYYLGSGGELDVDVMTMAQRFGDRIFSTEPLSRLVLSRVLPPRATTDAKDGHGDDEDGFRSFVKSQTVSDYHPIGTCSMGGHKGIEDGVVDARLRVYGVKGLRVVDASIMPLHISSHLQATTYAIAEKGADMILEDAGVKAN
ncbi:hypothetical protein AJ79_03015 [Helicocarpus griseus UAMH5409]|uniref:Glucose-methanol-choline oxidoreductase N-terminal domain-containing protein n=1 Tax=Helicocarpus griseus UAMH5409 TaxID=1447875 RepID=A0A2B7Y0X8_9EURO|nr:hypothetical protein AJ79_03015 [Helicocarpus griseus UAMH5409]